MEDQQQKFSQNGGVGQESTHPSSTALVLEGGSYRGIFTAGILDVLREKGVTNFESVWGVSAGAINAVSFRWVAPCASCWPLGTILAFFRFAR